MASIANYSAADEARQQAAEHFWPHGRLSGDMTPESGLQVVDGGSGVWVEDLDGNRWFDTMSALWLVNIGHVPHPEYWPRIRDICDRYGVILIVDEVITGFGRTGKLFATEHWGIQPDIRTVAKALTGGYMPIGAAIASGKLADAFTAASGSPFQHLVTFGGNPPVCAAAMANLDILLGEGMVQNSAQLGEYLFERLQTLRTHRIVGDVRGGMGLLAAIELVKDRDTKERFAKSAKLAAHATRLMRKHRMLGRAGNVIPVAPPLCVTRDEIDHAVSTLDRVLGELQSEL